MLTGVRRRHLCSCGEVGMHAGVRLLTHIPGSTRLLVLCVSLISSLVSQAGLWWNYPSKEGIGVCLHLPREGDPAAVVNEKGNKKGEKGVEGGGVGWGWGTEPRDLKVKLVPVAPSGGSGSEKENDKNNFCLKIPRCFVC